MSIPRRTHRLSKATLEEARWAQSEANRLRANVRYLAGSHAGSIPKLEAKVRKHRAVLRDYRAQLAAGAQYDRGGAPLDSCIRSEWSHLKYALRDLANDRETLAATKRLVAQWEGIVSDIEGAKAVFAQGKLV